ncbi:MULTISPECIES: dUTP diphosphatase [unclassified Fusobacterium]|uniref:dUTP diphosphatase n=1 Tax=unclassified Fusobacterium TaxID=2648384 RepID=UPI0025C22C9D|nr:dUTP diphosphatase [Fusobacterium sp.]
MEKVAVKVLIEEGVQLPKYETSGSAGMDVRANIKEPITLGSLERVLIPTGIKMAIPEGYEVQVRPRSGLALKHGISMANAIGTIDSDYRGDIGVILINLSKDEYVIQPQERIGQLVLNKVAQMEFEIVDVLDETERGAGGFGHTGK